MKSRESLIRLKRFQVDDKRRQVTQIEQMIADFERMVADLDREIEQEQMRAGIDDISHFAYPTYAKAARERRNNLAGSIENLQIQLSGAQDALNEAVTELKKVEILEERNQGRDRDAVQVLEQNELDDIARRDRSRGLMIG